MRIYNGTKSVINLPYAGQRLVVPSNSISGEIGATTDLLSLLVTAYTPHDLAIVVSGPFELNMCSSIPTVSTFVVQSVEDAVRRFIPEAEPEQKTVEEVCDCECDGPAEEECECKCDECACECAKEDVCEESEAAPVVTADEAPTTAETVKKPVKKKKK